MNSTERVCNVILGKPVDRQPIYGWVFADLREQITGEFGSVEAFEDHYEFDMAHLFGGPGAYREDLLERLRAENEELTPDLLINEDFFSDPDDEAAYEGLKQSLTFHKERGRFCYVQTPGFFEPFNGVFGIENHLLYLLEYTDEIAELYRRQADWTIKFIDHCVDIGVDMIHFSDDWGSQRSLMFSPELWRELIFPNMKRVVDHAHARGVFASLHSDGCVSAVTGGIVEIGFDLVHPWQESAGMSYDLYLEKYADQFAILGGVCVQTVIGLVPQDKLEQEIRRVFGLLKGKRWVCCTTHFVTDRCTMEDLRFAFDMIYQLARE